MFFGVVVPKSSPPKFHRSSIASGSTDAKGGRLRVRPLLELSCSLGPEVVLANTSAIINLPRPHDNDAQLIARGPKRVEKLLLRRRLILRRLANRFGSTYVGVPRGAKLKEIREKSHWIFRLFPTDRSNRSASRLRRFGDIFLGLNGAGIDHKDRSLWCGGVLGSADFPAVTQY
jgi:hypothetical protein